MSSANCFGFIIIKSACFGRFTPTISWPYIITLREMLVTLTLSWRLMRFPLYDRKVHKYGKSTTGESWDIVVDEETYYE